MFFIHVTYSESTTKKKNTTLVSVGSDNRRITGIDPYLIVHVVIGVKPSECVLVHYKLQHLKGITHICLL